MKQKLAFDDWMKLIDRYMNLYYGVSYDDIPDQPYHDWYDDGCKLTTAAKRAIKYAQE